MASPLNPYDKMKRSAIRVMILLAFLSVSVARAGTFTWTGNGGIMVMFALVLAFAAIAALSALFKWGGELFTSHLTRRVVRFALALVVVASTAIFATPRDARSDTTDVFTAYGWDWRGGEGGFLTPDYWILGYLPWIPSAPIGHPVGLGPVWCNLFGQENWTANGGAYVTLSSNFTSPGLVLSSYDQSNILTISNGATYSISGQTIVGCTWVGRDNTAAHYDEAEQRQYYYETVYPFADIGFAYPVLGPIIPATLNLTDGSTMNCGGSLFVGYDRSGVLSLSGGSSVAGTVVLGNSSGSQGTLNVTDSGTITSLSAAVSAGSAATINISENSTLQLGFPLSVGAGTFTLNNGGQFSLNSLGSSAEAITINNLATGTLNLSDAIGFGSGGLTINNRGVINTANGTNLSGSGTLTLSGTLSGPSSGTLNISTSVANANGTILADGSNSVVLLTSGIVTGGVLTTANGGLIQAECVTIANLSNTGTLDFSGGSVYLQGQINNTGVIQSIGGGDLSVSPGQTATLTGGGEVLLNGGASFINYGGTRGALTNQDNLIHGWGMINGNLVNNATVSADSSGHTLYIYGGSGGAGPEINNGIYQAKSGGILCIETSVTGTGSIVANAGTVTESGDVTLPLIDASLGTFQLQSGKLTVPNFLGTLTQTGGTYATGATAAVGSISGDYTDSSGSLLIKLGGTEAGQSDQLNIGGNATLNGTLQFQALSGFAPGAYDAFPIINIAGTRTGTFGLTEGQTVSVGGHSFLVTFRAGNGNSVALYNGTNPNAVPIATATPNQPAYVSGNYSSPNTGVTFTFKSLDVLPGAADVLGPNDTLVLTDGPLYVAPGAVFSGNGIVVGNIINAGLIRIPIVRMDEVSIIHGPGYVKVTPPASGPSPTTPSLPSIVVNPGTAIEFPSGSGGGGAGGSGGGAGGSGNAFVIDTPHVGNQGTIVLPRPGVIGYDASLQVTGSFTQEATGALRMFIGGSDKGVNYSTLAVGQEVTLAGELQIVLQPELFDFTPTIGETFDLIDSPVGITIPDGLIFNNFVTAAGASYFPGFSLTGYNSGIIDDPDQLLQINPDVFTYTIIHSASGDTLQATYIGAVPEPGTLVLLLAGTIALTLWWRARHAV
jgi:hypothetical protein